MPYSDSVVEANDRRLDTESVDQAAERRTAMAASAGFRLAATVAALLLLEVACVAAEDITDILKSYGLPEGLLPGTVRSHTLAENGKFEVTLGSTCTTKIGPEEVYYKQSITGELSYGKIKNLDGIQVHQFFWLSVTGIEMDGSDPNILWFQVGWVSKALSIDYFQVSPTCNSLSEAEVDAESVPFSEWLWKALDGKLKVNVPKILEDGKARKLLQ